MIDEYLKKFCENAKINVIDIGCSGNSVKEVIKNQEVYYIKESKFGNLDKEYFINNYLKGKLPVPEVIYFGSNENKSVMITKKLDGEMICCDEIFDDMKHVVELASKAIKILQNVNVDNLIINNDLNKKLALAKYNIDNGLISSNDMTEENQKRFGNIENAYIYLVNNKVTENNLCLSHGDLSIPNVFYKDDKISGFLDLGDAGIADMWYDIAILVKSLRRNYETKEAEKYLFECLHIEPDYEKIEYYILLTELFL